MVKMHVQENSLSLVGTAREVVQKLSLLCSERDDASASLRTLLRHILLHPEVKSWRVSDMPDCE